MDQAKILDEVFGVGTEEDQTCTPDDGLEERLKDERLYEYQRTGARWLASRTHGLLSDSPGLGKSAQALKALPARTAAVVVAPASVQRNWVREVEKWRPDLVALEVNRRQFRIPEPGEVIIARWSSLPEDDFDAIPTWYHEVPIHIIYDEIHLGSNSESCRAKRAKHLSFYGAKTWLLSGTPMMNQPGGLWNVLDIGQLTWPFGSIWRFQAGVLWDRRGRAILVTEWLREKLGKVMLRRTKEEVLTELPPKRFDVLEVPVEGEELRRLLDRVLEEAGGKEHVEQALEDALGAAERLRVETILSRARAALSMAKLPAALELVLELEAEGEKVVAFSCHVEPVGKLGEREGWGKIDGGVTVGKRLGIIEEFAERGRGIAITTAAAEGVNLHAGGKCATMIRLDRDWNVGKNAQVADRIHRVGQTRSVRIVDLVADHEVDHIVHRVLVRKEGLLASAGLLP